MMHADSFVVKKKEKKPKISAEDCCRQIMQEMKNLASIAQYSGQIQSIELEWVEDFFENEKNVLTLATQEQLQKYYAHKQKSNQIREEYEKALCQERNFLKQFEQEVLSPVKKKGL